MVQNIPQTAKLFMGGALNGRVGQVAMILKVFIEALDMKEGMKGKIPF